MISMILLINRLAEPTNEDGGRPKVTGGPAITPIELPQPTGIPTYRAADQEGTNSLTDSPGNRGIDQVKRKLLQSE